MGFQRLNFLALNNNNFQGSLPEVNATELVVLALHKNHLSGVLPSLLSLQHLGVLTLHENSIGGSVNDLSLSATCIDNSKFKMLGMGCVTWKRAISNFKNDTTALFLDTTEAADVQELKENCPSLFGCPGHSTAYITLHRNRFSCKVPAHIAAENVTVAGLVIMGNMLGFGHELNSSWILPEEKQSFLYYSGEVWKSNRNVLYGFLVLLSFAALCYPRRQRLQEALWNLDANGTAWVASSHFALWPRFTQILFVFVSCFIGIEQTCKKCGVCTLIPHMQDPPNVLLPYSMLFVRSLDYMACVIVAQS